MADYWVHNWDPFIVRFNDEWGIRWYGLAYILGFLSLYIGLNKFYTWKWSPLNKAKISDFIIWIILGVLIGGRLGYCLFYDWDATYHNPLSIIDFWSSGGISGMASHGGFIGVMMAILLFARRHGYSFWLLADNVTLLATLGLFFGRIA
ncbi:MAG: prolipoprotein diacylglyceryl transferase family protein, partial [Verrucomicrobiota bacterium]